MTIEVKHGHRGQLGAPRQSGGVLVDPPFDEVAHLVAENSTARSQRCYDLHGRCLSEVAEQARRELLRDARRWTAGYRDVDWVDGERSAPIFLAGHQPHLFHPGVWFKNFALGTLSGQHGAVAVNLLIDTDTLKSNSLPVPGGSVAHPHVEAVSMDRGGLRLPFEERRVVDREMFGSFGRRVQEQIAPLVPDPLVREYWPMVLARLGQTENLGACLAQARHQLEGRWGSTTLEVPESMVCQSDAFRWFVAHLLAELPRLWAVYNEAVGEHRWAHRIRSAAHPVPDLAADGEWLEAPLWIWTVNNPRRRRLFVKQRGNQTVLSDRDGLEIGLPFSADGEADRAVERLKELADEGVKIRCRALITTLWARIALGDLFLHGIGGAKYDQVTDTLIERFFGLKPPRFQVLSATLHLPVPHAKTTRQEARSIAHRLRELTYHPEVYVDERGGGAGRTSEELSELVAAKRRWIRTPQTPSSARTRWQEIRRINTALQPWVAGERRRLLDEQDRTAEALRAESVLSWREYGFCLFPEKVLREFLFGLLPKNG